MIGIIPAAGAGQRIQPLGCCKELLPVGSRLVDGVERPQRAAVEAAVQPVLDDVHGDQQQPGLRQQRQPRGRAIARHDRARRRAGRRVREQQPSARTYV